MAKVTITLEDKPGGRVEVICNPKFEEMAKAITGGLSQSDAYGMGLFLANALLKRFRDLRQNRPMGKLILPALKPGRLH